MLFSSGCECGIVRLRVENSNKGLICKDINLQKEFENSKHGLICKNTHLQHVDLSLAVDFFFAFLSPSPSVFPFLYPLI